MRTITIPDDLHIDAGNGRPPVTFTFCKHLIRDCLTVDPKFGTSLSMLHRAGDIRLKFKDAKPGDVVELSTEEWETLKDVAMNPSSPYLPGVMIEVIPYLELIRDAKEKTPERGLEKNSKKDARS